MARRSSRNTKKIGFDPNKFSEELRAIILEEGMAILGDVAKKITAEANSRAPKDTSSHPRGPNKRGDRQDSGPIKGSIFYTLSPRVFATYLICSPAWYSHFVEYGTQRHEMPRADFQEEIKQGKRDVMTFPGTNQFSGKWIHTPWVFHPGITPKPFLRPAVDMAEQFLRQVLNERYGV